MLHPGAWVVAGVTVTAMARLVGACLAGDCVIASHMSALWVHGVVDRPPKRPQVLVPYGVRGPTGGQAVRVRRTRRLPDDHVCSVEGIRVTTVARTLLDVAGIVSAKRLRNLVVDARHRAGLDVGELARMRREFGAGRRGMAALDRVLADPAIGIVDSGWEAEVREFLAGLGFRVVSQFPYRCADGVLVRLDNAIPDLWVCIELDGRAFHSDRQVFATDRMRWNQIGREWTIVWVTYDRWVNDRDGVMRDILGAVAQADASRTPARPAA